MQDFGIGGWLTKHAYNNSQKTALVYHDRRFSYYQLNQRVNQLAHALISLGVRKGDRVNGLLFNTNEMIESMFACAKIGAIFVPINYRLSGEEVLYIVNDSRASHFIYDERKNLIANELKKAKTGLLEYIQVGATSNNSDHLYEELIVGFSSEELNHTFHLDDIHLMMYTSGTTGKPKGTLLSHGNTLFHAINVINVMPITNTDSTLTVAPLFHIGGMNILTTPLFYKGGTVILDDVFNPDRALQIIQKEQVTTMFLVPAMWQGIAGVENFDVYDLSSLKFCISGGAPCPITIIEFFQERGVTFFEGFGLTETAPVVSVLDADNAIRKNGSVGKPPMHTELRVVDPYDQDVPIGEVGELIAKGPNITAGYWNKPEATEKAIKDGWFHTGDLAKFDDEGFLYIVDRKKDLIITGGENVYPIEVEQALYRHPNVREVAIIGYPDEQWGESIKAVVALKDTTQSLSVQDMKQFLDGKLARFKFPRRVEIVEELPRNATGKILKVALRESGVT